MLIELVANLQYYDTVSSHYINKHMHLVEVVWMFLWNLIIFFHH